MNVLLDDKDWHLSFGLIKTAIYLVICFTGDAGNPAPKQIQFPWPKPACPFWNPYC